MVEVPGGVATLGAPLRRVAIGIADTTETKHSHRNRINTCSSACALHVL